MGQPACLPPALLCLHQDARHFTRHLLLLLVQLQTHLSTVHCLVAPCQVDGMIWDMARPLEGDCALQILSFDDPDGKDVSCAGPAG